MPESSTETIERMVMLVIWGEEINPAAIAAQAVGLERFKSEGATVTLHCALLRNDHYDLSADIQSKLGSLDVNLGIEVAVSSEDK